MAAALVFVIPVFAGGDAELFSRRFHLLQSAQLLAQVKSAAAVRYSLLFFEQVRYRHHLVTVF